jgi:hypothetical protein
MSLSRCRDAFAADILFGRIWPLALGDRSPDFAFGWRSPYVSSLSCGSLTWRQVQNGMDKRHHSLVAVEKVLGHGEPKASG